MGPDELDDLLSSIKAEGKKGSALALYEGVREDDLVDENIDERILKLLGLDDVFDIDYGTYVTLLKERLAASRSFSKKLSTEEDELLVEEFRKVKGKVGRFKIKRKKISAENLGVTGPVKVSTEKFYLTSKAIIPQPAAPAEGKSEDIKDISEALDALLKSIIGENKREKKNAEKNRKDDEQKRRTKRESDLEKPIQKALGLVKKIVAPFQSILDRIMRFIQFTLLGFLVDKVLKWFADPKNKRKVEILGRFLKDWWPSLAFAAGLFLTPLGAFIRTTLKMLRGFIPRMVQFMARHPLVFAAVTGGLAAGAGEMFRQKEEKRQIEREAKQRNVKPEVVKKELVEAQRSPFAMFGEAMQNISGVAGGGRIKRRSFFGGNRDVNVKDIAFEEGGGINDDSGVRITGAGPDTQLIAAQPGEVMMSKKAVDKYGANFFLGLNKRAGGTNIPRMVSNIQLAAGGGKIKKIIPSFQGGGMIGRGLNFLGRLGLPGTGSVMAPNYTDMGYQNKFLGMNLNRVKLPQIPGQQFSQSEVQRYNQSPTAPSTIRDYSPYDPVQVSVPRARRQPTTPSTSKNRYGEERTNDPLTNTMRGIRDMQFSEKKLKAIEEQLGRPLGNTTYGETQKQLMDEFGRSTFGEQRKLLLGPQSRAMPVGTPTIISRTQTIVMPPQTMPGKKPSVPVKTGTQIPDVSTVARIPHREMVTRSLGIGDLMGVG